VALIDKVLSPSPSLKFQLLTMTTALRSLVAG